MNMPIWEKYPELVEAVRHDHKMQNALVGKGHDFAHALMVSQYATKITYGNFAVLGWIAGICHNTDRLFPRDSPEQIAQRLRNYLKTTHIEVYSKNLIVEAVLNHSKKPSINDSPLTMILMDADKLANLGYLVLVRAAQFQPNIPSIDLRHWQEEPKTSTYKKPCDIYWNMKHLLEWENGYFRLEKAEELAKPYFDQIRNVVNGMVEKFKEVGLLPYPFLEDFAQ